MAIATLKRTAAICAMALLAASQSQAENLIGVNITEPGQSNVSQSVRLGLNKSTVIDLPRPVADVVITNAGIADAVVQTTQRIIFRGVSTGETNAFLFDDQGRELLNLEIVVESDLTGLKDLLARHLPEARVNVEAVNGAVVLTGAVASASESEQVIQLVNLYGADEVVNMMSVAAKDQVLLEVRVVEMSRSYLKQLGIRPNGDTTFGDAETYELGDTIIGYDLSGDPIIAERPYPSNQTLSVGGETQLATGTGGLQGALGYQNFVGDILQSQVNIDINALERVGIARTLAEPNITAVSGETATFLAGGEFPIPTPSNNNGVSGIEFRQYGVGLGFTPVVLSENRISLKIGTEVSELTAEGSVSGVPGLAVRRVESTVELPSGRSMMLAGLIQSSTRQELDQIPGIKNVPVLGTLFQSRDFANDESELVIIITPYLVDPAEKSALRTPADGFANPSDTDALLFGRLNRMYGEGDARIDAETYRAPVGFIEE
ncbi:MAG: type II and III secretion system protein family protein [Hyphomonadaceae bacterium]|nr:type II and III secretion system protein family protein [Hyphomonadaceae bacterium]